MDRMVCFDCGETIERDTYDDADLEADGHLMEGCNNVTVFKQ